ncbi:DUF3313 family protein [Phenylobacterium terrae]|uniref:DUF3313 family protein n=1 Tax=Phenylobacterium terrae TaxID=2665495 RepID=A0ABW4N321_9CAUL
MRPTALATASALALAMSFSTPAPAAEAPASWDGLAHVESKRAAALYLLPGADFSAYTKVMLDPTEVAFQKNWLRDYNRDLVDPTNRISEAEAEKLLAAARTGFEETFRKAYSDGGFEVVTSPGPDVLRVRTAVIDLRVTAPDVNNTAGMRVYARDAGAATVVLEARDSQSGALLGRAVDRRTAGDGGALLRTKFSNRHDFGQLFKRWAESSVAGLNELKARPPLPEPITTADR